MEIGEWTVLWSSLRAHARTQRSTSSNNPPKFPAAPLPSAARVPAPRAGWAPIFLSRLRRSGSRGVIVGAPNHAVCLRITFARPAQGGIWGPRLLGEPLGGPVSLVVVVPWPERCSVGQATTGVGDVTSHILPSRVEVGLSRGSKTDKSGVVSHLLRSLPSRATTTVHSFQTKTLF